MLCFSGCLSHLDDDPTAALPSTGGCRNKHSIRNKNRFSTSGLDKFSKVMTELHARREHILAMAGLPASAVVLFMYNNSRDWIPIIAGLPKPPAKKSHNKKLQLWPLPPPPSLERATDDVARRAAKAREGKSKKRFKCAVKGKGRERLYWGGVMVLILVCLVTFAVRCTTIWW